MSDIRDNTQPDRSTGYNKEYWNAVAADLEKQAKAILPNLGYKVGNWKPLVVPPHNINTPPMASPKQAYGKKVNPGS